MVIRDIRNADVSSRSRVVPITIIMTINLVSVEIARGDVATRAGITPPALNYFWRKLTGGERRGERETEREERTDKATSAPACGRKRNETEARRKCETPGAKKLKRDGQRAVIRLTVLFHRRKSLFLLWDTSGAVREHVDVPVYKIYTHHVNARFHELSVFSMIFRSAQFFFLFGHLF